jgi:hypothetical protein
VTALGLTAEAFGCVVASKVMKMATAATTDSSMSVVSSSRFPLEPRTRLINGPKSVTAANMPYCSPAVGAHSGLFTRIAEMSKVAKGRQASWYSHC